MVSSSKRPKIIKKKSTHDEKFFRGMITDKVKKVVGMLINVHGIGGTRRIYDIFNLAGCWEKVPNIPLTQETYVNACLSYLRDPVHTYDALIGMNVLSHNESGDYVFGHPVILHDNHLTGRLLQIKRSGVDVVIGTVTTERGLGNGIFNTGSITCQSVRCSFREYLRAKRFYNMFVLNCI